MNRLTGNEVTSGARSTRLPSARAAAALVLCASLASPLAASARAAEPENEPAAAEALTCPPGTHPRGKAPPAGHQMYCVRGGRMKHGPAIYWHDNGKRGLVLSYRKGRLDGPWRAFYRRGARAARGAYRRGLLHGPFRLWHTNGQWAEKGRYRNNRREGVWIFYYRNGHEASSGRYRSGRREGEWRIFDPKGKLKRTVLYKHGKIQRSSPAGDDGS